MHEEIQTPVERATSLVELVLKTRGADHLKLSGRHLSAIQYYGIDLIVALGLAAITFNVLFSKVCVLVMTYSKKLCNSSPKYKVQ